MLGKLINRLTGAPLAFTVRVGGRGLALVAAIVLARALGADGYGIYAYAIAWTAVLSVPALLGVGSLLLRRVPVYLARERPDLVRGLIAYSYRLVVPWSLALVGVAALTALVIVDEPFLGAVLIALVIVPLRAATGVVSGVLQGLRKPELSFLPIFVIFPLGLIALAGGTLLAGADITAELAVAFAVAATLAGLVLAAMLARRFLRPRVRGAGIAYERAEWRKELKPFTVVAILTAVSAQIGLLLTGTLGSAAEVAVLQAAQRLTEPIGYVFMAITVSAAPQLARFHELRDRARLRATAQRASRASLLWSVPIGIAIVALNGPLFGLFGDDFTGGGTALAILAGAALFNAFAGSVGNILLMTGNGGVVARVRAAALALNIALCVALIPPLGVTGAAIARAADVVAWNSVLAVVVWRRLGVNATAAPWPRAG